MIVHAKLTKLVVSYTRDTEKETIHSAPQEQHEPKQ